MSNSVRNGVLMGAAGAGTGYLVATYQTADLAKKAQELTKHADTLKQPIIDKFQRYGYTDGMNIGEAAWKKAQELMAKGWIESGATSATSKQALDKVWNKTFEHFTKMKKTYDTEMKNLYETIKEITSQVKEITSQIKATKTKYALIGAGIGIGLVVLNNIRKAIFSKD